MPRRKSKDFTRDIGVDMRYNSELVQKLINVIMVCGKKTVARQIVYGALDIIQKKVGGETAATLKFFNETFEQLIPAVEVKSRRVGGSVYQVPREVQFTRGRALAIRWLISAARSRSNKTMAERLAYELLDAHEKRGGARKKKDDVYKMAEANRAFSHYAW